MRLLSLDRLVRQASRVAVRFPWTLAAGIVAAASAVAASAEHGSADDFWVRLAFVAALALPGSLVIALFLEMRESRSPRAQGLFLLGAGALGWFFQRWPGIDRGYEALRYFQLSAALHLAVATVPFIGRAQSHAFWQYNRRLFTGFLRASLFSAVLFAGAAVALGALDHLFGFDVKSTVYLRLWLIIALLANTWIFLAQVPPDLHALESDADYPSALKVFAQFILTPLALTYLLILLAYLVKIVIGGQWPSGWIGWLVASVAVTGLLGFLLVHPLAQDAEEGWIRTYSRVLFPGLIPAALMLLVAFWKRILPYGLTEPRVLGVILGFWLLGVALLFTLRPRSSIRAIPATLASVLAVSVYGPLSLNRMAVGSQADRLAALIASPASTPDREREASAALRYLMDRDARPEVAEAIGRPLPVSTWPDRNRRSERDSVAALVLALRGVAYEPEFRNAERNSWFVMSASGPIDVAGFRAAVPLQDGDSAVAVVEGDSVRLLPRVEGGMARIEIGSDTVTFDLRPFAARYVASPSPEGRVSADRLRFAPTTARRRAILVMTELHAHRRPNGVEVDRWTGLLLIGR